MAALFWDHFTTHIKISSKSVKFQISTQNQNLSASLRFWFFSWKLFEIDYIFIKQIKKNVPKYAEANNGDFKHKIVKN